MEAVGGKPPQRDNESGMPEKADNGRYGQEHRRHLLDIGKVITPKGQAPVAELEIELFSGDQDDMIALGRELAAKYNLTPGNKSKFQVGLELIEG